METLQELQTEIDQLKTQNKDLLGKYDTARRDANVYSGMVHRFIRGLRNVAVGRQRSPIKKGCYPFIPLPSRELLEVLYELYQNGFLTFPHRRKSGERGRFLDAGAGIGNQVLLAQSSNFFYSSHGVEYDPRLVEVGNKLHDPGTIMHGDILTFDKYADYDVIYYYVPMNDREMQRAFEERLEDKMTVGSLVLAFGKNSYRINKDSRFLQIKMKCESERVFKKIAA